MNINKQQKYIEELLNLIKENPDLEILPMVSTECVCDDYFSYWTGKWGKARIDEYWIEDERVCFKSVDEDYLFDKIYDEIDPLIPDDKAKELVQQELNQIDWTKAIVVYINAI